MPEKNMKFHNSMIQAVEALSALGASGKFEEEPSSELLRYLQESRPEIYKDLNEDEAMKLNEYLLKNADAWYQQGKRGRFLEMGRQIQGNALP